MPAKTDDPVALSTDEFTLTERTLIMVGILVSSLRLQELIAHLEVIEDLGQEAAPTLFKLAANPLLKIRRLAQAASDFQQVAKECLSEP